MGLSGFLLRLVGFPVTFHSCSAGVTHVHQACVTCRGSSCVKGQRFPWESSTPFPVNVNPELFERYTAFTEFPYTEKIAHNLFTPNPSGSLTAEVREYTLEDVTSIASACFFCLFLISLSIQERNVWNVMEYMFIIHLICIKKSLIRFK